MIFKNASRFLLSCLAVMVLGGCFSSPHAPAPVENRTPGTALKSPSTDSTPVLPGSENANKPGYYMVQKGDTLTRIGLDHGQTWRDLVRWNGLPNPNQIEVGQVLRIAPPGASVEASGVVVQPVPNGPETTAMSKAPSPATPTTPASAAVNDDGLGFVWPAEGTLLAGFDEVKNKGLDIGGKAGDAVLAAADGQVVYAGAGLRGYGNLIILKHNNTFLTAYAHNQALLVKEDQKVRKGQKIAEMGKTDADRVKLHFEIRRQGKPVDPAKYLPVR